MVGGRLNDVHQRVCREMESLGELRRHITHTISDTLSEWQDTVKDATLIFGHPLGIGAVGFHKSGLSGIWMRPQNKAFPFDTGIPSTRCGVVRVSFCSRVPLFWFGFFPGKPYGTPTHFGFPYLETTLVCSRLRREDRKALNMGL